MVTHSGTTTQSQQPQSAGSLLAKLLRVREFFLILLILAVGLVLHAQTGRFFSTANLNAITLGFAANAIMVVGMTAALVSGGFDLSVGSVYAFGGVITAIALRADLGIPLAILCGLGVGVLAGALNGLLITKAGINPFITTLGMMGIARGASYAVTEGSPLARLPEGFFSLGQGRTFEIPNLVLIALAIVLIGDILMRNASACRQVYYVGGNEEAARLSGINVTRVKIAVYTISGLLAALAGLLSVSRFTVADPGAGMGTELQVIAACIIGGSSLKGGKGTVFGALLGLLFVGMINNGMVLLRVPVYWQQLVMGAVLLLAVGFDTFSQRWQERASAQKRANR